MVWHQICDKEYHPFGLSLLQAYHPIKITLLYNVVLTFIREPFKRLTTVCSAVCDMFCTSSTAWILFIKVFIWTYPRSRLRTLLLIFLLDLLSSWTRDSSSVTFFASLVVIPLVRIWLFLSSDVNSLSLWLRDFIDVLSSLRPVRSFFSIVLSTLVMFTHTPFTADTTWKVN